MDQRCRPSDNRRVVCKPSETVLEGTIRLRKGRSLAQLQELMHFNFGQEPVGVTDRLIVFERLVGESETSSGELLDVQVKCAVLLERDPPELRAHLLLTFWFTS